jgi:hypothetical protein
MADNQERPLPERADILRRTPAELKLPITGDLLGRLNRVLQVTQAYDLSQLQSLLTAGLQLRGDVGGEVVLVDATRAPFRTNGLGWQVVDSQTAGGGLFATLYLYNNSQSIICLDELRVGGSASEFVYGFGIPPSTFFTAPAQIAFPYYSERQQVATISPANTRPANTPRVTELTVASPPAPPGAVFVDGTDFDLLGRDNYGATTNPYTIINLEGVTLYPNVAFLIQQLTAVGTLRFTMRGRIWRLAPNATTQFGGS